MQTSSRQGVNLKHGHNRSNHLRSKTYASWVEMKTRCLNPSRSVWLRYGGRGITVCPQWLNSFETFLRDMGVRPKATTLERCNNDGNYEPNNCVWATTTEQSRNKSVNVKLTYNGETLCIADWASRLRISRYTLYDRIRRGWTAEEVLLIKPLVGRKPRGLRKDADAPTGADF